MPNTALGSLTSLKGIFFSSSRELYSDRLSIEALRRFISKVVLILNDDADVAAADADVDAEAEADDDVDENVANRRPKKSVAADVEDIISFEKKLASISTTENSVSGSFIT